jgi:hypothetical protein
MTAPEDPEKMSFGRGWVPLAVLPAAVLLGTPADWPRWLFMWLLAIGIFAGCKWLTWRRTPAAGAPWWRHLGYLAAWPGLDAAAFLGGRLPDRDRPGPGEWLLAAGRLLLGAALVWGVAGWVPADQELLAGWVGMVGLVLLLHFGAFHLLSCAWRAAGVEARPLMNRPLASAGVGEFWGRRWNTAFRDLTHRFLFRPLTARLGPRRALLAGFVFSGRRLRRADALLPPPGRRAARRALARRPGRRPRDGLAGPGVHAPGSGRPRLRPVPPALRPRRRRPLPGRAGRALRLFPLGRSPMQETLELLIFLAGFAQLGVLVASALVPVRLDWRHELAGLSRLHRQMYWVYGGYVVLAIVAFGLLSLGNARELAAGGGLARGVCGYIAVFWGVRLSLQAVLDVKTHLTAWWLRAGYHTLTVLFLGFTLIFGLAALRPAA